MSVRIVATGRTGTIGRHFDPSVVDLGIRLERPIPNFGESLKNTVVLHSAALVGEESVRRDLSYSYSVNVTGAVELARAVCNSSAERFIYVSTSHVYERRPEGTFLNELDSVLPLSHYGLQKLIAERLISEIFRDDPSRLTIARVFSILHQSQPLGTLGFTINNLRHNSEQQLHFADDVRDFLSPKVVAKTLTLLAKSPASPRIVNICSGIPTTVREAVRLLLGDESFRDVQERISRGQSPTPRIVGNSNLLGEIIQQTGSELFAASLDDWAGSRSGTE